VTAPGLTVAQLPAYVTSSTRVNGWIPVELTSSWNGERHATGAVVVATNVRCRPAGATLIASGPHSISFGNPFGCPTTQRALVSAAVSPATKTVPGGPTRWKYIHRVVPALNRIM
jgi:hypothetical protein